MTRQLTKDVEIAGRTFRLRKMTAIDSSRIHNLLISVLMSLKQDDSAAAPPDLETMSPEDRADGMVAALWLEASQELERKVYQEIQKDCLMNCSEYVSEDPKVPPMVVMLPDGRYTDKGGLETDIEAIGQLIVESLKFNIAPAFLAGLSKAAAKAEGLTLPIPSI